VYYIEDRTEDNIKNCDSDISSTSGGRSVGIVRSRTKGHGVCFDSDINIATP
jgi:hypothetical protein